MTTGEFGECRLTLPTLHDVARLADVSYATVDRLVNKRGGVADKSRVKIESAIAELGYQRNIAAANLARKKFYNFAFVIPTGSNAFFDRVRAEIASAIDAHRTEYAPIAIHGVDAFDPKALNAVLQKLIRQKVHGVVLVGYDSPDIRKTITKMRKAGIVVMMLVSDIANLEHDGYVGIDNTVAGKTAGRILGLAHGQGRGKILPVMGSTSARDHVERFDGFRQLIESKYGNISLCKTLECFDRRDLMEKKVRAALKKEPGITAIYSIGAGNAGLLKVFEDKQDQRPIIVAHELVSHARAALETGVIDFVIDQRPEIEVATALKIMRAKIDGYTSEMPKEITPEIFVAENLPPAPQQP